MEERYAINYRKIIQVKVCSNVDKGNAEVYDDFYSDRCCRYRTEILKRLLKYT
jgi:hypothetical protein